MSLLLVFLVVVSSLVTSTDAFDNVTVNVYYLLYHPFIPRRLVESVGAGFNASLAARQWTVAPGVTVKVIHPPSYGLPAVEFLKKVANENENEFFAVVGPIGDDQAIDCAPVLKEEDLVAFGPSTGSSSIRGWNPNLYFLRVSPRVELLALIRFAITQLRLLRIGFMYLQGVSFGDVEFEMSSELLSALGSELCCLFAVKGSHGKKVEDSVFDVAWNKFVEGRPQAVIMFAAPTRDTMKFFAKALQDNRTSDMYILSSSVLEIAVIAWRNSPEFSGVELKPGRVVFTRTNSLPTETGYRAIRRFQGDARSYLRQNPNITVFNGTDDFDHDEVDGRFMVYGWLVGEVLSQALRSRVWYNSRRDFMNSLYSQRRYVVDEFVLGEYGGKCEGMANQRGAACECNQGGNVVYVSAVGSDFRLYTVTSGRVVVDSFLCYHDTVRLKSPLISLLFHMQDNQVALGAAESLYDGAVVISGDGHLGEDDRFFVHRVHSAMNNAYSNLEEFVGNSTVTAVFGITKDTMLSVKNVAFIDPIHLSPRLSHPGKKVVYLSPTLEQQLFVLIKYIVRTGSGVLHAVVRGEAALEIVHILRLTLVTFGGHLGSVAVLGDDTTLEGHMPEGGDVVVVGLTAADVAVVASYLDRNDRVRVLAPFFDVALLYTDFVSAFEGGRSSARLLFSTNLPHWADANTTSRTVQKFHAVMPDASKWKPLSFVGFAAARFMQTVILKVERVTADTIIDAIDTASVVHADDMRYGPFAVDKCFPKDNRIVGGGQLCYANYGATRISVWSFARALDASVPPLTRPRTPSMQYLDIDAGKLSAAEVTGIIVGVLVVLLLFAALLVTLLCLCFHSRNNDCAPREATNPVTLIFTDVESSTAQWAAHPELMPDAVAVHHSVIRSLISRYGCYEVKTVGDSFMIACKSAFAAANVVRGLQQRFLQTDWGTALFDESYREFEHQRAEANGTNAPPTGLLDPEVYKKLWNGLRVRVGVHTGLCDIRQDEVTKGYDYYGKTTDAAARVESLANGGQVLLTGAAYFSLSVSEREQFDVTPLGSVSLGGVRGQTEIYQLNAVPGRSFSGLRLDHEVCNDLDGSFSASTGDTSSVRGGRSGTSQMISSCLLAVLGTFSTAQRHRLLVPLCDRWHVPLPRISKVEWDERVCEDVIRRISARVGRVVDLCASGSERTTSTLRSASVVIFANQIGEFEGDDA